MMMTSVTDGESIDPGGEQFASQSSSLSSSSSVLRPLNLSLLDVESPHKMAPLATPEICINDVAVNDSDGECYGACGGSGKGNLQVPNHGGQAENDDGDNDTSTLDTVKKQWRRSSWCPEEERKKEEKHEKQRMILAVVGKSQSLSSLEGENDDSSDDDDITPVSTSMGGGGSDSTTTTTTTIGISVTPSRCGSGSHPAYGSNVVGTRLVSTSSTAAYVGIITSSSTSPMTPRSSKNADQSCVRKESNRKSKLVRRNTLSAAENEVTFSCGPVAALLHKTKTTMTTTSPRCAVCPPWVMTPAGDVTASYCPLGITGTYVVPPSGNTRRDDEVMPECGTEDQIRSETSKSLQETLADVQTLIAHHDAQLATLLGPHVRTRNGGHFVSSNDALMDRNRHRLSFAETGLSTPYDDDDFDIQKSDSKQGQKIKGRGSSMFSKLGSYRQKKVSPRDIFRPKPERTGHSFVRMSFGGASTCDVCGKSVAGKPAVQCQNCLINVHDSCTFKDQPFPCISYQTTAAAGSELAKKKSCSLPGGAGILLKAPLSTKEKRALSVPSRVQAATQNQTAASSSTKTASSTNQVVPYGGTVNTGYFQWRRVATKLGIDRVVSEDRQQKEQKSEMNRDVGEEAGSSNCQSSLGADLCNASDSLSVSVESLDDYNVELADLDDEDESELLPAEHEAEAWSVTVDKKTLKRMSAKNIKRQDHIWELVQTEKSHYRTLKIIQKIFVHGLRHELNMSQEMVYRMFPRLDDLIDIHLTFLHNLIQAQKLSVDKSIDEIGTIVLQQFGGKMGERVKVAYGEFCSRHNEAMQLYKDLLKSDSAFQAFIKKCSRNCLCKRLGIPECILLVTQRMTKYPMLVESILKTTPESSQDANLLTHSLSLVREILSYIDQQVDAREKEQRLFDLYNKLDARSFAILNGKKFKKSDLLSNNRKLLHDGHIKWMSARGKPFEVLAVLLSDVVFFLAESGQKCTFFSQDNKMGVISLSKLLIREKGDTRDSKGIYLICQSKTEPEMYEFVCRSVDERQQWIQTIRKAIINCPEEGEPSESEEERKLQEAIGVRLRQLIELLHQKDHAIFRHCEEKMSIALEILEIFAKDELSSVVHQSDGTQNDSRQMTPDSIMQAMLYEVSKLFSLMQPGSCQSTVNVIRSLSNADRHASSNASPVHLPRRADTFSGFEGRERPKVLLRPSSAVSGAAHENTSEDTDSPQMIDSNQTLVDAQSSDVATSSCSVALTESSEASCSSQDETSVLAAPLALNREQCTCMAKILQYIHQIVCFTARLTTEKQLLHAQFSEASCKLARLHSDTERTPQERHDRKSPGYHPDKQLEELRSLQGSIQQQKSDLDRIREQQMTLVNSQRDELEQMQLSIDKQKMDIKSQKDELQRQREALQRQVDLFEEQRGQFLRSLTSPQGRVSSSGAWPSSEVLAARLAAATASRYPPEGSVISLSNHHHRSASDDLPVSGGGRQPSPTGRLAEDLGHTAPIGRSAVESGSSGLPRNGARVPPVGVSRRDTMPPMHLLSATNEARAGLVQPQQLPLKLASTSDARDSSRTPSNRSSTQHQSPSSNSSGLSHFSPTSYDRMPPADHHHPQSPAAQVSSGDWGRADTTGRFLSSPTSTPPRAESVRLDRDAVVNGIAAASASPLPTGVRFSSATSSATAPSQTSASRPTPPRLVTALSSGSILPLKLAERQRPKSASSTSSSPVHQHGSPIAPPLGTGDQSTPLLFNHRSMAAVLSQQQLLQQQRTGFTGSSPLMTSSSPTRSRLSPDGIHSNLRNVANEKEVIYF